MENNDIVPYQGQFVIIPLSNCLDPQAKCEIKVVRVRSIRYKKNNNRIRTTSGVSSIRGDNRDFEYFGHLSNITVKEKEKNWK